MGDSLRNSQANTLSTLLDLRAEHAPGAVAYYFVMPGDGGMVSITYAELSRKARAIAATLRSHKGRGERAVLLYPAGLEFVAAFFGCLYEGVIAVPVSMPRARHTRDIGKIVQDSGAQFLLTCGSVGRPLQEAIKNGISSPLCWIETDTVNSFVNDVNEYQTGVIAPESLAYLQYTSGSTSQPRGVMISHANVLANCADLSERFPFDAQSTEVSWLPHFHDMGLVTGVFLPMFGGSPSVLMSPAEFVQRPEVWLQAITRFRGTHSVAPNFAYQLCLDKIPESRRPAFDLSSWKFAACSSEPIRNSTMAGFVEAFAPQGFQPFAFRPAYGLAEATLMVTSSLLESPAEVISFDREKLEQGLGTRSASESGKALVGAGQPMSSTRVKIVNPETGLECQPGTIGEIWVSGPGVGHGYWNNSKKTDQAFHCRLPGDDAFYLRTGDLGLCHGRELFVTGRLKDMIILCGRNHYAADIEEIAALGHAALRSTAGAAFSVEADGEEQLVIVHEVERTHRRTGLDDIVRSVVNEIVESCGVEPYSVLLLKPGTIPKTSSGKVRHYACREMFLRQEFRPLKEWKRRGGIRPFAKEEGRSVHSLQEWLISGVADAKGLERTAVDPNQPFSFYGFGSRDSMSFTAELEKALGIRLPASLLYEFPSVKALSGHLAARFSESQTSSVAEVTASRNEPVAIIGIGCRFPGAVGPQEFWKLLEEGRDEIKPMPEERSRLCGLSSSLCGGFIKDVDLFDAAFFHISSQEAERMDPQHRILLETVWQALEDAGLVPDRLASKNIGVFVGIGNNDYSRILLSDGAPAEIYSATGNSMSIAANRISYTFDWRGPSMSIDTACASSLVALHVAARSLWSGECELALVSGVAMLLSSALYQDFEKSGLLAPDFRCKAFDEAANGYVRGEGAATVVLKPLSKALQDCDPIYCVVRGTAANHNGRSHGILAPVREGQAALLRQAWKSAGVSPRQIQYVENHGTGTLLGDAVEANALGEAMGPREDKCWMGSVKTNIGHLESCAGIAGLIKTALAIHHGTIPANLHFKTPNPNISWKDLPLKVADFKIPWPSARPRVAGVSSFGFGGANAHAILQEAPSRDFPAHEANNDQRPILLPISAYSRHSLPLLARSYAELLNEKSAPGLEQVCFTAATRRTHHSQRIAILANSHAQAAALCLTEAEKFVARPNGTSAPLYEPVFVYCGQGGQRPEMGLELLSKEPAFRRAIEQCDVLFRASGAPSASEVLTGITCPALEAVFDYPHFSNFSLQIALTALWRDWGIVPGAVIGHSLGEIAAACTAGALSLEDAVRIVVVRSRLVKTVCGKGGLLSVSLSSANAQKEFAAFRNVVSVAVENSPSSTVLSGDLHALETIKQELTGRGVRAAFVKASFAGHGPAVDPLRDEFIASLDGIQSRSASIPIFSTAMDAAGTDLLLDAEYWWKNLRNPVRLTQTIRRMWDDGFSMFLEVGAHPLLTAPILETLPLDYEPLVLPSLQRDRPERTSMLQSLGALYCAGAPVQWEKLFPEKLQPVALPLYPFERKRHWIKRNVTAAEPLRPALPRAEKPAEPANVAVRPGMAPSLTDRSHARRPRAGEKSDRRHQIQTEIVNIVAELLHQPPAEIDVRMPLLEMGADSIVLVAAVRTIHARFHVELSIRQLLELNTTVCDLAEYIDQNMPSKVSATPREVLKIGRRERILGEVVNTVAELLHQDPEELDPHASFLEMGADSIVLVAAIRRIHARFNVAVSVRQLMELNSSAYDVAEFIDSHMPEESEIPEVPPADDSVEAIQASTETSGGADAQKERADDGLRAHASVDEEWSTLPLGPANTVERVLRQQISAMNKLFSEQMRLLENVHERPSVPEASSITVPRHDHSPAPFAGGNESSNGHASATGSESASSVKPIGTDRPQPIATSAEFPAPFPLTYMQRGFWFLQQLAPESTPYNVPGLVEITGPLDFPALRSALRRLMERHPALRMTFHAGSDGEPVQVEHARPLTSLELVNAESWTEPDLQRQVTESAWAPFDFERGVFRASLFHRSDQKNVLLFNMHHLIGDLWSVDVVMREIMQLYRLETGHGRAGVQLPRSTFHDYVRSERHLLEQKGEALWEYWQKTLTPAPPELELPTDRKRPPVQTYGAARRTLTFGPELTNALQKLASAAGSTLFMTLLAAFEVLLHRYTRQTDIVIGSPVSGRSTTEWNGVVGCFINMVPLRLRLKSSFTFRQVLTEVRACSLAAFEHQEYPFSLLVERLKPLRDPSRPPLVSSVFVFLRNPGSEEDAISATAAGETGVPVKIGELSLSSLSLATFQMPYELVLMMAHGASGLFATLQYNTELFDDSTGERILGHLRKLLTGVVNAPGQPVDSLGLLTEQEEEQLRTWNSTQTGYRGEQRVHELFEMQAARTPDAPAIEDGLRSLTYRELDIRTNELAKWLQLAGVGPEKIVAVCLHRSLDIAVSLLGVMKAGGAYLPLDPSLPEARLQFMLEDSEACLVITEESLQQYFGTRHLLRIDAVWKPEATSAPEKIQPACTSANLVYVLYTSGSTGQPKGVQITHQSLVNFLVSMERNPGLCSQDVLLSVTTMSFDIFGLELYLPLSVGAKVVIAPSEVCMDGPMLLRWLHEKNISVMQATPSTWQLLLSANGEKNLRVRAWIGGDALSWDLAQELMGLGCPVWNLYGPTETTIWSTLYRPMLGVSGSSWVPVGAPIGNTKIHILDEKMEICPVGIAGEIYIGGEGLARGYWKKPMLTAENFIPDPFCAGPGQRLYRTGDLGRWRSDGTVEFIGRGDHQVKIRGFRVELGEIETVLRHSPGVADCAVSLMGQEAQDKRLVAYVVPMRGEAITTAELRRHARSQLSEYMVPADFVLLQKLPLTPNGKVDRKALAAFSPDVSSPDVSPEVEYAAPRSGFELALAAIWERVLRKQGVGLDDNFFDLGGHSLLLTQVHSALRDLNQQVSILNLFQYPTIRSLVAFVGAGLKASNGVHERIPLAPRDQALPLSFAQRRLWLINELHPGTSAYNLVGAVEISGPVDAVLLQTALHDLVKRHESLRTVFCSLGGTPAQKVQPAKKPELEFVDHTGMESGEWENAVIRNGQEFAGHSFELATGPLFRLKLLKVSEEKHVLVASLHHIVADGWSFGIILRDLGELYRALASGQPASLPELPVQFADYAAWQQQRWESGVLQPQLDYWLKELADVPAFLSLPSDRRRTAAPGFAGNHEPFQLSQQLSNALCKLCREEEVTPFMVLIAAFALLLGRYSGQDDFVIGTDIANRNFSAIENLIGCFVNLLPLRMRPNANLTFREYLGHTRELARRAYANQAVPFDHLIRALRPERKLTNTPLVQVLFVLQNAPIDAAKAGDVLMKPFPIPMLTAEFEMILSMKEGEGIFSGTLGHSLDLFGPGKARMIISHFKALLEQIIKDPGKLLPLFSFLDGAESLKAITGHASDLQLKQRDLDNLLMQIESVESHG